MTDFSKLYSRPATGITRPKVLPVGDYSGVITKFEPTFNERFDPKVYQTRVFVKITGLPEGSDPADEAYSTALGSVISRDYDTMNEDGSDAKNLYMLNQLLESCGITPSGATYNELLPQLIGKQVLANVTQYNDAEGQPAGNRIKKMVGVG